VSDEDFPASLAEPQAINANTAAQTRAKPRTVHTAWAIALQRDKVMIKDDYRLCATWS
jgi:hypothetical protein